MALLETGFARRTPYRQLAGELASMGEGLDFRRVGELAAEWRCARERRRSRIELVGMLLGVAKSDRDLYDKLLEALTAMALPPDLLQEVMTLADSEGREE